MFNGSYSQLFNYIQIGGSIFGGVVVWSGGLNLFSWFLDIFVIMQVLGFEGVYVNG